MNKKNMIKPERKKYHIKIYMSLTYFKFIQREAKVRGISISNLGRIALHEYFNPRFLVQKASPILRIDRTPKGSKKSKEEDHFKGVLKELSQLFDNGKRILKRVSDKEIEEWREENEEARKKELEEERMKKIEELKKKLTIIK